MDTIEQKDRAMAPPKTPPVKAKVAPLPKPYRKEFSLTSGARYLGIGKGTLRAAIERNEVKATTNAKGHYVIEGAQIFQYEQNRDADDVISVPARASTRANTSAGTPPSTGVTKGAERGAGTPFSTGVDTPNGSQVGTVSIDLYESVKESLEARLRDKDTTISDLRGSVESWKTQAKSWQNHADNNLRLLTDEREKLATQEPDIDLSEAEQSGHFWRNIAAGFLVAALVGAAFYYRSDITNQWAKFTTTSDSTATAIESEIPQG